MEIKSYKEAVEGGLVGDILFKVISREGKSKNYTDLIPLDGGSVGIAHFAVGGLGELYKQMDTMKYFGKSQKEMIDNYSAKCRPAGKTGNDTGWGCYSQGWWFDGFKKFLESADSKKVQDYTWALKMQGTIESILVKGWKSKRAIAIALGIANSMGAGGFSKLATKNGWDAEKTLKSYVGTDAHRQRREAAIDKHFPKV